MADRVKAQVLGRALRVAALRAGAPSDIRFTERQLYYEVCRVLLPVPRGLRRPAFTVAAPVSYDDFRTALREHGPIPGLLTPRPARPRPAGRHTPEPDLFDYGLPRLLICESDDIAQMLRANGVPMESACPVLSAAELPLDPRVAGMLELVEGSAVYLLHDASAHGLTFPDRVRALTPIPDGVRVVPLGLRPRQAGSLHSTHLPVSTSRSARSEDEVDRTTDPRPPSDDPTSPRPDPADAQPAPATAPIDLESTVDPWESAWLRRNRYVEVDAVRPASLLRTVHRLVREVRPRGASTQWGRVRTTGFLTWPTA
ncbi:hypothetical protein [Nocardia noduli]|uniref:hypothetical protein n=1 Tax=Nocardia noduli TaxID=2815722 RepID=UPI001C21E549|nr:hypothetical protein [Nocardia noduli]